MNRGELDPTWQDDYHEHDIRWMCDADQRHIEVDNTCVEAADTTTIEDVQRWLNMEATR